MDNSQDDLYPMLPRLEALARLYQLRDDVERAIARRGVRDPRSESERHVVTHGHKLAFGCCRPAVSTLDVKRRDPGEQYVVGAPSVRTSG